ncbi:NAD-dependent epimerase/dehydratase family protein [Methylophilus methylotrophus]|uniref:NAD-dependent epimerase/dehydratase family protein n=1 Tax=Methylophilus methylotrophus TaxID=17 RepID=UPI000381296D|nr:SDR family oxidoreductase [Methylophilus methylotrophus]
MAKIKFTILGASGFIGSNLREYLASKRYQVNTPDRDFWTNIEKQKQKENLGHVIYCIGMTANFRTNLTGTIDSHITLLNQLIKQCQFESITYLSSTRVYEGASHTAEDTMLQVNPAKSGQVYNISKLAAESLCISTSSKAKIIRLSNVYGQDNKSKNFLSSVLQQSASDGAVTFQTSPSSSKDFVSINDVVKLIHLISLEGKSAIYNVASGENTANQLISDFLTSRKIITQYEKNAPEWKFEPIDNKKIRSEFGVSLQRLENNLPSLFDYYTKKVSK